MPVYELKTANYCYLDGEINPRVQGLVSQCHSQLPSGSLNWPWACRISVTLRCYGFVNSSFPLIRIWLPEAAMFCLRQTFIQPVFTSAWFKPGSIHIHLLHNPTDEPTLRVKQTATSSGTNVRWLFTAGSMGFTLQSKE